MSISSALSSAISGLKVTSRAADVVSSNLSNALTPGYGRRELEVQSLVGGSPGVRAVGITRIVDEGVVADRRQADSAVAYAETQAQFLQSVDRVVGTPEDPGSLTARLSKFEADLISASTNPDNLASLQTAVRSADDLTNTINRASSEIQRQRTGADGAIDQAVDNVNTLLSNIRTLNIQLNKNPSADNYSAGLKDQRQSLIDQLSEYIPVRQVPRDNGTIALFTSGGAILLDGSAAKLEFSSTNVVAPHMTLENGLLSGLTINGVSVPPSGAGSPIDGGRLAALFSVRDDLAVDAQTQLDAVSRDLLERFQDVGIDGTRAPGDPGLFTDLGAFFNAGDEVGLSGRISVNALVDPSQGGEAWKLRDGLGATTPGPEGNGTLIAQLSAALSDPRGLASGDLGANGRPASGHFSALTTRLGQERLFADQSLSFATSQQSELSDLELLDGVDSDAEMGRLLLIEQAYSANARMLQTIDDMMQAILRI